MSRTAAASAASRRIDPELIVPDPKLTLRKGAIAPWAKSTSPYYLQTLESLAKHYKFTTRHALRRRCPNDIQEILFYGSGDDRDPLLL